MPRLSLSMRPISWSRLRYWYAEPPNFSAACLARTPSGWSPTNRSTSAIDPDRSFSVWRDLAADAASARVVPSSCQSPATILMAYSPSSTSRPVTWRRPSSDWRLRDSTMTVSAAPARPCVAETESTKSSGLAFAEQGLAPGLHPAVAVLQGQVQDPARLPGADPAERGTA